MGFAGPCSYWWLPSWKLRLALSHQQIVEGSDLVEIKHEARCSSVSLYATAAHLLTPPQPYVSSACSDGELLCKGQEGRLRGFVSTLVASLQLPVCETSPALLMSWHSCFWARHLQLIMSPHPSFHGLPDRYIGPSEAPMSRRHAPMESYCAKARKEQHGSFVRKGFFSTEPVLFSPWRSTSKHVHA